MSRTTLVLILGLWVVLCLCQYEAGLTWAYDRESIEHGAYGLLLSGHLVHLNAMHLLLNMLGLVLVLTLFDRVLTWRQWLLLLMSSAFAISAALYWLLPQIERYVGLSGVIHALYAAGAVSLLATRERGFAWVLLVLLVVKLTMENYGQGISLTADMIGGRVLVQAHLYGAIWGGLYAAIRLLQQNWWKFGNKID